MNENWPRKKSCRIRKAYSSTDSTPTFSHAKECQKLIPYSNALNDAKLLAENIQEFYDYKSDTSQYGVISDMEGLSKQRIYNFSLAITYRLNSLQIPSKLNEYKFYVDPFLMYIKRSLKVSRDKTYLYKEREYFKNTDTYQFVIMLLNYDIELFQAFIYSIIEIIYDNKIDLRGFNFES